MLLALQRYGRQGGQLFYSELQMNVIRITTVCVWRTHADNAPALQARSISTWFPVPLAETYFDQPLVKCQTIFAEVKHVSDLLMSKRRRTDIWHANVYVVMGSDTHITKTPQHASMTERGYVHEGALRHPGCALRLIGVAQ